MKNVIKEFWQECLGCTLDFWESEIRNDIIKIAAMWLIAATLVYFAF
jgi:hypothetical protein